LDILIEIRIQKKLFHAKMKKILMISAHTIKEEEKLIRRDIWWIKEEILLTKKIRFFLRVMN
jgi:hypothetical protein